MYLRNHLAELMGFALAILAHESPLRSHSFLLSRSLEFLRLVPAILLLFSPVVSFTNEA